MNDAGDSTQKFELHGLMDLVEKIRSLKKHVEIGTDFTKGPGKKFLEEHDTNCDELEKKIRALFDRSRNKTS